MQVTIMLIIVISIAATTVAYRRHRDQEELATWVSKRGGQVVRVKRAWRGSGHPFRETGRGWWAWRIDWRDAAGEHRSYALTTRDGIKEWRD